MNTTLARKLLIAPLVFLTACTGQGLATEALQFASDAPLRDAGTDARRVGPDQPVLQEPVATSCFELGGYCAESDGVSTTCPPGTTTASSSYECGTRCCVPIRTVECGNLTCPVPGSMCRAQASGQPNAPVPVTYSCIPRPAACVGITDCTAGTCNPAQVQCILAACFGGWNVPGAGYLSAISSGGNYAGCGAY